MNTSNYTNKYSLLLILLLIFHLIANCWWIKINQNPLDFDPIGHTFATINSAEYVKNHLMDFSLRDYMKISPGYPNFVETATLPLVFLFGNHWKVIQFSGTIFFLLAIWGVFLYVKEISQNGRIAFFSAFFYSFFVSVVQYSRFQMLDIPLTAMIFLTLYFWEKFKKTKKINYWYVSALTLAFAQTSKWHAGIFLLIPFIFLLINLYKNHFFQGKKLFHFFFGLLISLILISPWYYYNFADFIRLGTINYLGEPDDPRNLLSFVNILSYPWLIINFQIQFLGFIFFIFSIIKLKIKKNKYLFMPLLTLIFCYLFFTFFVLNKNIRVIFALMPFIGLIMAVGAEEIIILSKKSFFSIILKLFLLAVISYYIFSYFVLSFGIPIKPNLKISYSFPLLGWTDVVYLDTYPVNLLYSQTPIAYKEIIKDIVSKSNNIKPIKVLIGVNLLYFHIDTLGLEIYNQERNDLNKAYDILTNKINLLSVNSLERNKSLLESLKDYDVILTAYKNPISNAGISDPLYQPIKKIQSYLLGKNNYIFIQKNSYRLPDGDKLMIFVNNRLSE